MAVTCIGEGRVLRVAISGGVDHHRTRAVVEELSHQIDLELPWSLTLDLENVTFMGSLSIAVLLRAYRRLGKLDGIVKVVHVPAQAGKVLRAAGLDKFMEFERREVYIR